LSLFQLKQRTFYTQKKPQGVGLWILLFYYTESEKM